MELKEILARCDHTLLKQTAVWEDIRQLCDEGLEFGVASVCIPPCFVAEANTELIREHNLRLIEGHMEEIAALADSLGLSEEELMEMFRTVWRDE